MGNFIKQQFKNITSQSVRILSGLCLLVSCFWWQDGKKKKNTRKGGKGKKGQVKKGKKKETKEKKEKRLKKEQEKLDKEKEREAQRKIKETINGAKRVWDLSFFMFTMETTGGLNDVQVV